MPVNNYFFAMVLRTSESKPYWLSELSTLAYPLGNSLKSWGCNYLFYFQREVGICDFPLNCIALCQGFILRVCLSFSYLFCCGYFINHLMYRSLSTSFWISLKGKYPMDICVLDVSVGGGKFRDLLFYHFGLESMWNVMVF